MEFGFEHPDLMPDYCTVCKAIHRQSYVQHATLGMTLPTYECQWATTADTTQATGTRLLFRLYDMVRVSVKQGRICYDCQDLIESFDSAKFKANKAAESIKFRRENGQAEDDDDDDDEDDENSPAKKPVDPKFQGGKVCVSCKETEAGFNAKKESIDHPRKMPKNVFWREVTEKTKTNKTIKFKLFKVLKVCFNDGWLCPFCFDLLREWDDMEYQKEFKTKCLIDRINIHYVEDRDYSHPRLTFRVSNFAKYSAMKEQRQMGRLKEDMKHYKEEYDLRLLNHLDMKDLRHPKIVDSSSDSEDDDIMRTCEVVVEKIPDDITTVNVSQEEGAPWRETTTPPRQRKQKLVVRPKMEPVFQDDDYAGGGGGAEDDDGDWFYGGNPEAAAGAVAFDAVEAAYGGGGSSEEEKPLRKSPKKKAAAAAPKRKPKSDDDDYEYDEDYRPKKKKKKKASSKKRPDPLASVSLIAKKEKCPVFRPTLNRPMTEAERAEADAEVIVQLIDDDYDYTKGDPHGERPIKTLEYNAELETIYRYPKWPQRDRYFVEDILARGNFDEDVTRGYTCNGRPKLLYRGHLYYRFRVQPWEGQMAKWFCFRGQAKSGRQLGYDCKAELATTWDDKAVILESVYSHVHNHKVNPGLNRDMLVKLQARKLYEYNPDANALSVKARIEEIQGPITHINNPLNSLINIKRKLNYKVKQESHGTPAPEHFWRKAKLVWSEWNNEEYVKGVLERADFETDLQVVKSMKNKTGGGRLLLHKGFTFARYQAKGAPAPTESLIHKWYCVKFWFYKEGQGCPARLVSTYDMKNILNESITSKHNHDPNHEYNQDLLFRHNIRKITKESPYQDPEEAYQKVLACLKPGEELMLKEEKLRNLVVKLQKKYQSVIEEDGQMSDSEEEFRERERKKRELLEAKVRRQFEEPTQKDLVRENERRKKPDFRTRPKVPEDKRYMPWTDEAFVRDAIVRGKFDTKLEYGITERNEPMLIYKGHTYTESKDPTGALANPILSGLIKKWRCTWRGQDNAYPMTLERKYDTEGWCGARLITCQSNGYVMTESLVCRHTHMTENFKTRDACFKGIMRQVVVDNPTLNCKEILHICVAKNNGDMPLREGGLFKELLACVRYYQKKYHNYDIPVRARRGTSAQYLAGVRRGKKDENGEYGTHTVPQDPNNPNNSRKRTRPVEVNSTGVNIMGTLLDPATGNLLLGSKWVDRNFLPPLGDTRVAKYTLDSQRKQEEQMMLEQQQSRQEQQQPEHPELQLHD